MRIANIMSIFSCHIGHCEMDLFQASKKKQVVKCRIMMDSNFLSIDIRKHCSRYQEKNSLLP